MPRGNNIKEPILRWLDADDGENAKLPVTKALAKFKKETKLEIRQKAFFDYHKAYNTAGLRPKPVVALTNVKKPSVKVTLDEIEISVFNTDAKNRKDKPQKDIFVPYKTNEAIDIILSEPGGLMKGTTIIVDGPPGVGKSTIAYAIQHKLRINYPKAKIICIQSEMKRVDLDFERQRKEWMKDVDFVLLSDPHNIPNLEEGRDVYEYAAIILKKIFSSGYNIVLLDSFGDLIEKLVEFCNMGRRQAETFLLGLFDRANEGIDNEGVNSAVIAINQVTKAGESVGSNKIPHRVTGTLHVRFDERGDRCVEFEKNRRNGRLIGKPMYFSLNENTEVVWDEAEFKASQERSKFLKDEQARMKEQSASFNNVFKREINFEQQAVNGRIISEEEQEDKIDEDDDE